MSFIKNSDDPTFSIERVRRLNELMGKALFSTPGLTPREALTCISFLVASLIDSTTFEEGTIDDCLNELVVNIRKAMVIIDTGYSPGDA